jgi:predicted PurR-regulated permease PerM
VAYLLGFTVILGMFAFLIYTAAEQVTTLVKDLPTLVSAPSGHGHASLTPFESRIVSLLHPFGVTSAKYNSYKLQAISQLQNVGKEVAVQSVDIITSVLGTVVDIILVLILSVYLTVDGERLARWMREQAPRAQRRQVSILFAIVNQVVGGYIRGTLTLALLIGLMVGIGMEVLVPTYAVLLGMLAFFMEFIPVLGVLVSGAVSVGLALAVRGPVWAAVVLVYFIIVHIVEGDIVGPRIMGRAVGIHPATALVALVAGTEIFGIWGSLFAAPLAGLLQAIGTAVWREIHGADAAAVIESAVQRQAVEARIEAQEDVAAQQGDAPGSGPPPAAQ